MQTPEVNDEFGDVFGMVIALTGDGYSYRELKDIADAIRDDLLNIADVAKVQILGVQEERVFIEYNSARLAQAGLSVSQLAQLLKNQNIVAAGGNVVVDDQRITIEPTGNLENIEELRKTVIQLPSTGPSHICVTWSPCVGDTSIHPKQKVHTSAGTEVLLHKRHRFPFKKPQPPHLA